MVDRDKHLESPAYLGRTYAGFAPDDPFESSGPPRALGFLLLVAVVALVAAISTARGGRYLYAAVIGAIGLGFLGGYVALIRGYVRDELRRHPPPPG
jgi:hypothetical protein